MQNVAIFLFPEVEVLDFAGPFEVFAVTRDADGSPPFHVYTVARDTEPVRARNGLTILPHHSFADCPTPDILIIPGGRGTRPLVDDEETIAWVRAQSAIARRVASVCTGAILLGKAGVLDGLAATTYHTAFDELIADAPTVTPRPGARWVDNGRVITSAGVSAGIDMALHLVGVLLSIEAADRTAAYMEYEHWAAVRG